MGLDISAYRKLTRTDVTLWQFNSEWQTYANTHRAIPPNNDWPERAPEFEETAVYTYEESFGFRAGSYGGYSLWREQLAALAGYPAVTAGPFYELINFSDCEGVIGAAVSAKLAKDFAAFQEKADAHEDEWFRDRYAKWRQAFEMAADGGCVDFH